MAESAASTPVKIDQDQDLTINGSLFTETGGEFVRHVGFGKKPPLSNMEVDGITTNLFKKDVTEIFNARQTDTQPNLLNQTVNGLTIDQYHSHDTNIHGTNTQITAGQRTEDLVMLNSFTWVGGTSYSEEYRGSNNKFVFGINGDLFAGMRSEFVQWWQINLNLGYSWLFHTVLKVLQIAGGSRSWIEQVNAARSTKMKILEIKINGARMRLHEMSGRFAPILMGLWRIPF